MMLDLIGIVPAWMGEAACGSSDLDPEIFFPHPGASGERATADVRRVCRSCPVVAACAEYAIANEIEHGVWGGLTSHKRRKLAGRKAKSDPPIPKTCLCCGGPVTGRGRSALCSDTCQRAHKNAVAREYQRARRTAS